MVWRRSDHGGLEVLLVHRPKYDDWSLPKGKLDAGEDHQTAALREVEEETGLRCRLGPELETVAYSDHHGRPKVVRYWAMTPEPGTAGPGGEAGTEAGTAWFTPTEEVDEVRWLRREEAGALLTHDRDAEVVGSLPE